MHKCNLAYCFVLVLGWVCDSEGKNIDRRYEEQSVEGNIWTWYVNRANNCKIRRFWIALFITCNQIKQDGYTSITGMAEKRIGYRNFLRKTAWKKPLGKGARRWENYMKMDLKKTRRYWGLGELTVSGGLRVVKNSGYFLTSWRGRELQFCRFLTVEYYVSYHSFFALQPSWK
jgi:hypothetical protein